MEAPVLDHNQAATKQLKKEVNMVTAVHTKVRLQNRFQWVSWVEQGFNLPLLPKLPTRFPFMSVAPYLYTPAPIKHSAGLVSLQHHSRAAVSSQL
jgi:hypothetical protein